MLDGDRIRLFTVADADFTAAEDRVLSKMNYGITLSHEEIGESVIELLKLPYGEAMEWTPILPEEEAPRRASEAGGPAGVSPARAKPTV